MHLTGLDLVFDGVLASTLDSPGVSGTLTAAAALDALLRHTGLTYQFATATTVLLKHVTAVPAPPVQQPTPLPAPVPTPTVTTLAGVTVHAARMAQAQEPPAESSFALPEVVVQEQRGRRPSEPSLVQRESAGTALFGPQNLREVPFSVNVITAQELQNRQVFTLTQGLATDPTVTTSFGGNDLYQVAAYNIRGFDLSNSGILRDGLPSASEAAGVRAQPRADRSAARPGGVSPRLCQPGRDDQSRHQETDRGALCGLPDVLGIVEF